MRGGASRSNLRALHRARVLDLAVGAAQPVVEGEIQRQRVRVNSGTLTVAATEHVRLEVAEIHVHVEVRQARAWLLSRGGLALSARARLDVALEVAESRRVERVDVDLDLLVVLILQQGHTLLDDFDDSRELLVRELRDRLRERHLLVVGHGSRVLLLARLRCHRRRRELRLHLGLRLRRLPLQHDDCLLHHLHLPLHLLHLRQRHHVPSPPAAAAAAAATIVVAALQVFPRRKAGDTSGYVLDFDDLVLERPHQEQPKHVQLCLAQRLCHHAAPLAVAYTAWD
mmetsp:Transcript_5941/g.13789  ORF Transcript_5941/g.13789 Transcript_5941/m.13789 type:complete len:284 (+) Transcript_5941:345-1196(+)